MVRNTKAKPTVPAIVHVILSLTATLSRYIRIRMDQLDPGLVQRVGRKVSAVVERYLLDDQEVTPKNTRKAYGPKQAEWMVSQSV
jgi:hypothetical protein